MTDRFVDVDGVRIRVVDEGQGPALLLLHGWSQSAAMFRHQVEEFRHSHRVLAPDFRGHGLSDKPAAGYRISRLAQDVQRLCEILEVPSAAMLGWSMGASVLWSYIDMFGSRSIEQLILVDQPPAVVALPGMSDTERADAGAILDLAGLAGLHEALLGAEGAKVRADFVAGMLSPQVDPRLRDWIVGENLRVPPQVAAALLVNHCCHDWRDLIPAIDVPTLVVGGEASHVNPQSQRWVAAHINGAELEIFAAADGGSHFVFLENPPVFNERLRRFLGHR
jgi:pimeloyl-ACP methyl ester carboxylesterase